MSLPREWSLQDSRGSLHRFSGPTVGAPQQIDSFSRISSGTATVLPSVKSLLEHSSAEPNNNTNGRPTCSGVVPLRFVDTECPIRSTAFAIECVGSLSSIHSAPPVPLATGQPIAGSPAGQPDDAAAPTPVNFELGPPASPASSRPMFLRLDDVCVASRTTTHASTHTLAVMPTATATAASAAAVLAIGSAVYPHTATASEADDEDIENLLTVSSLTARPLIAKSHELRTEKLAERFRHRNRRTKCTERPKLDGGYGWFVVLGAFFVQFWVAGLVKSYGVLFVEILETFPNSSTAVASWIPAILSALCLALAPLSSALCQRFSCRTVVFVGGLFCTFGLTLSYFATSLYHLLFTFGILTGIGGGLSTTPGIIIVSLYFDKHRALANGICVSGTAAGSFVFPMLIEHLVGHFGFHGTILVLGCCMLHVCASAALYRPIAMPPVGGYDAGDLSSGSAQKTPEPMLRTVVSSAAGLDTGTTCVGSTNESRDGKYIEHLFMEESKNRLNDYYNKNKFVQVSEKAAANSAIDSDDEVKDIVGETRFMKPIKSIRSSSLLHSVEDLSTDSTCVYKARSGFDSNRSSRRRAAVAKPSAAMASAPFVGSTDEMLGTVSGTLTTAPDASAGHSMKANRGLSKSMIIPTPVSDFGYDEDNEKKPKSCCDRIRKYLDISLLKDPKFIAMCLSVTMMSTGCPYMLYFLPAFALSAGYTKSEAGFLVAVSAALDLIGRLGFGYLSDLQLFDRKKAYIVCILGAGSAVLMIPSARSLTALGFASGAYGLCLGSWYLLVPVLLADMFGTGRISSSYGLVRMFQSVGAISVPPLAGFMRDLTGGYEICFYCMGTFMVLGSVPVLASTMWFGNADEPTTTSDDDGSDSNAIEQGQRNTTDDADGF